MTGLEKLREEAKKRSQTNTSIHKDLAPKSPGYVSQSVAPIYQAPPIDKNRAARAAASRSTNEAINASNNTATANATNAASAGLTAAQIAMNPAQDAGGVAMNTASMALAGSQFGAPGAAVGAGAGLAIGLLQASAAKKRRQQELENQKQIQLAQIEQNKSAAVQNAISNMAARLGSTLNTPIVRF